MGAAWDDERKALVSRLWEIGHSARQIAERVGDMTRSGVIGLVHRMSLPPRLPSTLKDPTQRRYNGNRRPKFAFGKGLDPRPEPENRASSESAVEDCPPSTAPVLFMERLSGQCTYITDDTTPISERLCCGAPIHRHTSWCKHHLARVEARR